MGLLFSHRVPLSRAFAGHTECHCHILPGVDDGFQHTEDSIEALRRFEKLGVVSVWLTPHIMEDMPNTTDSLRRRFDHLCAAASQAGIGLDLHLASENMMDGLFEERLASSDLLPMMEKYLLVETSYYNPPCDLFGTLRRIMKAGYFPILAHPERYIYMDEGQYRSLKQMEVMFQLNLSSFAGLYGGKAQSMAKKLLSSGSYEFCGTDLHHLSTLDAILESKVPSKLFDKLPK